MPMFSHRSVHEIIDTWKRTAAAEVDKLDRSRFSDPALTGQIDQLVDRLTSFEVATLHRDGLKGTRREVDEPRSDYGRQITVKQGVMDVAIPYTGSAESFGIQPSNSVMIAESPKIGSTALTLSVRDGRDVQGEVDGFIQDVTKNLETLRQEIEAAKPHVRKLAHDAAERRRTRIQEERQRDAKLNFPVE